MFLPEFHWRKGSGERPSGGSVERTVYLCVSLRDEVEAISEGWKRLPRLRLRRIPRNDTRETIMSPEVMTTEGLPHEHAAIVVAGHSCMVGRVIPDSRDPTRPLLRYGQNKPVFAFPFKAGLDIPGLQFLCHAGQ